MRLRPVLTWGALGGLLLWPLWVAATSPLLAWREPVYIVGAFAGVVALALLVVQPLLAVGKLPGLGVRRSRRIHAFVGAGLVTAVVVHVVGLWVTSPPDVVDALLFRSATGFSAWGVVAMWAVFAAALLAALRARMRLVLWRLGHVALAVVVVAGTVVHALLIDGTMGPVSKIVACGAAACAVLWLLSGGLVWADLRRVLRPAGREALARRSAEG